MFLLILDYRIVENIIMTPLNSIMFLLILQNNHLTSLAYMPLNSIMFLLIQISKKEQKNNKHIFKFHYVSINSPVSVP